MDIERLKFLSKSKEETQEIAKRLQGEKEESPGIQKFYNVEEDSQ